MNKLKIFEIAFLTLVGLSNILPIFDFNSGELPSQSQFGWGYSMFYFLIIILFVSGIFYLFILGKIKNPNSIIKKPRLGNNPLKFRSPLEGLYFGALFFLIAGGCMILTYLIKNKDLSQMGLMAVSYGIGLIITIKLALLKRAKIENKSA